MAQSLDETDLFRSLAVYDPGLVDRCAAYVRSGTEPDLPDRLAELATQPLPADTRFGLATVGELFDILMYEPGAFHPRYGQHTKNYHVALEAVRAEGVSPIDHLRARRDYFASSAPIAMMVRLARLLACGNPDRLVDGVPPWFTVLVNEMHGKRWTGEALAEALAHAGTPATQIPSQVLLATFQTPGRWFEPNSVPRQVRGLDEYLVANSELIPPEAPNVLRADARLLLLARTSLTDGLPAVVGALTCDSSKKVRVAAIHALGRLPGQVQAEVLVSPLSRTSAPRAMEVVDYLVSTAHGSAVLTGAVAANPRLATTVAEARERRALLRQDEPTDRVRDEPQTLELPRYEPLPDEPLQLEQVERMLARRAVRDRQVAITSDYVEQLLTVANGTRPVATGSLRLVELWGYGGMQQAVAELPMLGLKHLLRLAANDRSWRWEEACALMVEPDTDLRAVEDAIVEMGLWDASTAAKVAQDAVANLVRNRWFSPRPGEESDDLRRRAAQATWPWLSQHPEVTRTWLGGDGRTAALRVLVHFPFVPHDLAPQVASIALGGGKPQRRLAQQALASHPSAQALAAQGLGHTKPETRIAAADWLTGLADATAVPVLRTALGKEKNQLVRSALLDALDALGADLDAELSPAALEAEAVAGLKRKPPVSMAWFPLDRLPALRWADGSQVPPQVPRWWVVLAVKTKNPDGSGLLDRYLSLLHPHDADLLGRTVLQAWVDYDTRRPDPAESHAYAQTAGAQAYSEAQERLTSVQGWGSTEAIASARAAAALTVEQHTAAA
ncbi:MAG: HEAT repeat domain-containing protein, partial [Micrococcales bacterium]|nr:HEAT repeat domain-containing protein [Micrococcales bacterium]